MKDQIIKTLNKIINSRAFIVIIGVIIVLKTIFFYNNTVAQFEKIQIQTSVGTISFIVTILCFVALLPNRVRIYVTIFIDVFLSILLWADNIYYTYSSNVLSIMQISNLQYTDEIVNAIPSLFRIKHIIYILDVVIILTGFLTKIIKIDKNKKYSQKQKICNLFIAIIGVIIFCVIGYDFVQKGEEKSYNRNEQIIESTIYGYHISDIINIINLKNNVAYNNYNDMIVNYNQMKNDYEEYNKVQYDFEGILENKNILVLQLESVQEFVVNRKIEGKEITPNLNKFLNENITFSNMNMQSYSSTADSEYSFITSTYPMENGMSFTKYFLNEYDDIFKLLKERGYYTSYMHGNVSSFWNRGNFYSKMDLDDTVFIDEYEDKSEMIAGYLSDELFYKQSVEKLKQQETPFFTFMVSSSSHCAFNLPGIIDKYEKVNIDVGKYKNTYFGDYLEAINYADYAFGILIEELKKADLYDDMAIIIFGDHNGLDMYNEELEQFLKETNDDIKPIDLELNYTKVLCGMKIPGNSKIIKISKPVNKLDIKPTLAYLCNLEDGFSLGTNMFASKDFIILNNERIILEDYYYDGMWHRIQTSEDIDLENIDKEEREKLEKYYYYMKRELDISFSVNIKKLLKNKEVNK